MLDVFLDNWLLFLIGQYPYGPLGGFAMTLIISLASIAAALPLGVVIALMRLSEYKVLSYPAYVVIQVMRGTPIILLIFWMYFIVPMATGYSVSGAMTTISALVLYKSAYIAEIVRGAILALPRGQTEAAKALGLRYRHITLLIVLPQALYNSIPSLITQMVGIVKDSSLGYIIGTNELTFAANQVNASLLTQPFNVYMILGLIYFAFNFSLATLARMIEKRMGTSRRPVAAAR